MTNPTKQVLIRHLRRHHPSLLSRAVGRDDWRQALEADDSIWFASAPLPSSAAALSEVPMVVLVAVHEAAHIGLYFHHGVDDWLCREFEADEHHRRVADQRIADS